jgi:thiol-disulfide isomerase/thioredoxin
VIEKRQKEVPTLTDTNFIDTIFTPNPGYQIFSTNESIHFYGEPGAVIKIQLDSGATLKERVKFSGDLSEMNNYLLEIEDLQSRVGWSWQLIQGAPEGFLTRLDSINSAKTELLKRYQKKSSAHPFWKNQKEMIKVSSLLKRFDYINTFKAYHKDSKLSEELRQRIKPDMTILFGHPELLNQSIMRDALDNYIFFKSLALANQWITRNREKLKEEGFVRPNAYEYGIQYAMDSVKDKDVRNFLFYDLAERGLRNDDLASVKTMLRMFNENCTNPDYVNRINSIVDSKKAIQPGEPAIEIVGFDANGKKFSLSDFKGKLIYVDVWATWCGPCIGEFPSFKTLVNTYKDKDIVFIQYSVNEVKADWLKYREKNEGMDALCLQLIKESDEGCKIMEDYKFNGIPRYLLFDAKGRIISTGLERPEFILETKFLDKYLNDPELPIRKNSPL